MAEEVNIEETYSQVAEQNAAEEVKPKKSKKWIWISIVTVVVILLVIGGVLINVQIVGSKLSKLPSDGIYMMYKCLDYCPYSIVYSEWGEGASSNSPPVGKGEKRIMNIECKNSCEDINMKPSFDEARDISENRLLSALYKKKRDDIGRDPYGERDLDCMAQVLHKADKSCLDFIEDNKGLDAEFTVPNYENVTLNFTSLSCSQEVVEAEVDLIEGEILGIGLYFYEKGDKLGLFREEEVSIGPNTIIIPQEKFPQNLINQSARNPDKMELVYFVEHEDYPEGRISDIYSARLCE